MDRLLRQPEVENVTGMSGTTLWRKEKAGEFPQRRRISGNIVGWRASEVAEWIETRPVVAAGDGEAS